MPSWDSIVYTSKAEKLGNKIRARNTLQTQYRSVARQLATAGPDTLLHNVLWNLLVRLASILQGLK